MNTIQKIGHWADTHHPTWIDYLRICLGVYLFIKGIIFLTDLDSLIVMLPDRRFLLSSMLEVHYIAFVHIIGGIFIAVGLITRISALLQLPILIVAVFWVNIRNIYNWEFWISLIVLILLVTVLLYGSGKFSITGYAKSHPEIGR